MWKSRFFVKHILESSGKSKMKMKVGFRCIIRIYKMLSPSNLTVYKLQISVISYGL